MASAPTKIDQAVASYDRDIEAEVNALSMDELKDIAQGSTPEVLRPRPLGHLPTGKPNQEAGVLPRRVSPQAEGQETSREAKARAGKCNQAGRPGKPRGTGKARGSYGPRRTDDPRGTGDPRRTHGHNVDLTGLRSSVVRSLQLLSKSGVA